MQWESFMYLFEQLSYDSVRWIMLYHNANFYLHYKGRYVNMPHKDQSEVFKKAIYFFSKMKFHLKITYFHVLKRGGGYLVERWVRGCAAQIGCFFGLSFLPMAPFLFENWFRYRSRLCKMHNFRWFFSFSLLIGCQKVLMHPNYMVKSTDWFKKRALKEANDLVIGCKFAPSLV